LDDLASVLNLADEAIILVDEELSIRVANAGAEKIFGYGPGDLIGKSLDILIPARFLSSHRQHIARFAATAGVYRTAGAHREVFGLRRDGTEFPAEASIARTTHQGQPALVVILRDISARKQAERHLLDLLLEHDRATIMSEMIGDIAHDLKTPISVIHANVYLIKNAKKPEDHERRLDAITAAAQQMEQLTKSLTTVSKWVEGREVHFAKLNINDVLTDLAEATYARASERGITFEVVLTPGLDETLGSEDDLISAVGSLLGNALLHTSQGGSITLMSRRQQGGLAVVVEDTGEGFIAEDLPLLFDPQPFGPGTSGLGLTMVRKIVDMHAGNITVESTPGEGSTFTIWLPIIRLSPPPQSGK
jgi:PAS domain S-box-containing protein